MCKVPRKAGGQPIRDAMKARGWSTLRLAEETRRVDPNGKGISNGAVGRAAGTGKSAGNEFRIRTAWLVALALQEPLQDLFGMPAPSTSTVERSTPHGEHRRSEDPTGAAGRSHPAA